MRPTILSAVLPHPPHAGLPPPSLDIELVDAGRAMGWIADARVGFRGFASAVEAAHAAWIAWRALQRRAARRLGARPVPVDEEPLTLRRVDGHEAILAGTRPIAILLRPGPDRRAGPDSFAFELQLPASTDEVGVRAEAYVVYRALRRSGVRWALWRPEVTRPRPTVTAPSPQPAASGSRLTHRSATPPATGHRAASTRRRRDDDGATTTRSVPEVITLRARVTFTAIAIVAGVTLLATVSPVLVAPLALFLLSPFLAVRWLVQRKRRNGTAPRLPGQRTALRRLGVVWASLAMLGSTVAAMAFLKGDAKRIALAPASGGAVACIGVAALRLSDKQERSMGVPPRVGFASAARLDRTAPPDGLGYLTRRELPEEKTS